jgi:hypothetical protein
MDAKLGRERGIGMGDGNISGKWENRREREKRVGMGVMVEGERE